MINNSFLNKNPLYGYLKIRFDFLSKAIKLIIIVFYFDFFLIEIVLNLKK